MFLIYVNVLPNGLKSQCKLFGDGTSLFYIAYDINTCVSDISKDLKLITDWVFQWKMSFYADPCKQAQEVIISRKKNKGRSVHFNNISNSNNSSISVSVYKHLVMLLADKLSYKHPKFVLNKVKKAIGLLHKFQQSLLKQSLSKSTNCSFDLT